MKLLIKFILILAIVTVARANMPGATRTYYVGTTAYSALEEGTETVSDTVFATGTDTLIFPIRPGAMVFGVTVKLDSIGGATDSFKCHWQTYPRLDWAYNTWGSSKHAISWRESDGTSATILDWASGSCYEAYDSTGVNTIELNGNRWIGFYLSSGSGADSIKYKFVLQQLLAVPDR
jgi:hypothetical protein